MAGICFKMCASVVSFRGCTPPVSIVVILSPLPRANRKARATLFSGFSKGISSFLGLKRGRLVGKGRFQDHKKYALNCERALIGILKTK